MASGLQYFVTLQDGDTKRHCWVDKRVRTGNVITLKDSDEPARLWTVIEVSAAGRTKHELAGQRGWHVGGL